MIVKIDDDFIKKIKDFITNNPVKNVVFNVGSTYEVPCNLVIGDELLWEGHESSDWITDKPATDTSMGLRRKKCTRCGKTLEEEVIPATDAYYETYFTFYLRYGDVYSIEVKDKTDVPAEIYLPSSYSGKPVTRIEPDAFSGCKLITKITIPKSIVSIGDRAFQDCDRLESVEFAVGSQLTDIGVEAFDDCNSLTSIVIPDSVTSIGKYAFYSCGDLTTLVIGDNVETIGERAFAWCWNITKVVIPDSVTSIEEGAFAFCDKNLIIYCEATSQPEHWDDRWNVDNRRVIWDWNCLSGHKWGDWTFDEATGIGHRECKVCGEKESNPNLLVFVPLVDGKCYVRAGEGLEGGVVIPSIYKGMSVMAIADGAFRDCTRLTSIAIPDSIVLLGINAFYDCYSLINVVIGNGIASIGSYTFYNCSSLKRVVIPDSVTSIGNSAFFNCSSLESVVIGKAVTSIDHYAFAYCSSLTSVVIPDSVTSIGYGAFLLCKNLSSAVIGNGVTSIGGHAFGSCSSLVSVTIPDSVTSIGYEAFRSCSSLVSVVIPDSVTSIGGAAFASCSSLESVVIPDSVTSIGDYAFYDCDSLTIEVAEGNTAYYVENGCLIEKAAGKVIFASRNGTIPSSASSVGSGAFSGDYAAPIKIPLSVTFVESLAFAECENLVVLVEAPSKPEGWADDWCDDSVTVVWGYNEGSTSCTHYYGVWNSIYAPTCTKPGVMEKVCTLCGRTEIDTIPALGHVASDWIIDIEATTEAEGSKHKECTVCGEILETATIPKLESIDNYILTESGEYLTDEQGEKLLIEGA